MKVRIFLFTLLVAALALTTLGVSRVSPALAQEAAKGYVRVIHAAPGAPDVNVFLDAATAPAVSKLAFGASTSFLALDAKAYRVTVRAVDAKPEDAPVLQGNFTLQAGQALDVAVIGRAGQRGAQALRLVNFPVDISSTDGQARVYVYHFSPDAPAVDVRGAESAIVSNLAYGAATRQAVSLAPGKYSLNVVAARTTEPVVMTVELDAKANMIYTVMATGLLAEAKPVTLTALPLLGANLPPKDPTGWVRFTNASAGGALDLYFNGSGTPAVAALAAGASTDLMELKYATYSLQVRPAGSPAINPPVLDTTLSVEPKTTVDVVAAGVVGGEPAFGLQVYPLDRSSTGGKARVYLVYAGTSTASVDLRMSGKVVAEKLTFGQVVKPLVVDAAEYNLTGVAAGTRSPVLISMPPTKLDADTVYTIIAYGDLIKNRPLVLTASAAK